LRARGASVAGGGLYLSYGGLARSCTISNNVSDETGGGANLYYGGAAVSALDVFKKKPYEPENSNTGAQHLEHPVRRLMILLHPNTENAKDEGRDHTHHEAEDLIWGRRVLGFCWMPGLHESFGDKVTGERVECLIAQED